MIRVVVWNEYRHELHNEVVRGIYPEGIHGAIKTALQDGLGDEVSVSTATLGEPEHGLTDEVIQNTDVILWWGHLAHDEVSNEIVDKLQRRVLEGMGLIVLHSAHASRIFQRLMGTGCMLRWRESGEREKIWVVDPSHPIAEGIENEHIEVPAAEMYGEFFDVPPPDELVFVSWFEGGEVFRSGCTWKRGKGKVFFFRPGHETYPIFHQPEIKRVLVNAVRWAAPSGSAYFGEARNIDVP